MKRKGRGGGIGLVFLNSPTSNYYRLRVFGEKKLKYKKYRRD